MVAAPHIVSTQGRWNWKHTRPWLRLRLFLVSADVAVRQAYHACLLYCAVRWSYNVCLLYCYCAVQLVPMSLLACLGNDAEPIRDIYLARLQAASEVWLIVVVHWLTTFVHCITLAWQCLVCRDGIGRFFIILLFGVNKHTAKNSQCTGMKLGIQKGYSDHTCIVILILFLYHLPPLVGASNGTRVQKLSDFWHASLYLPNGCETGPQLMLSTNRKSHTGFSLVTKFITLKDLAQPIMTILRYKQRAHLYSRSPVRLYSPKSGTTAALLCNWFVRLFLFFYSTINLSPRCSKMR